MKRYFEIITEDGTHQTLKLDIENGSQAATASVDEVSKHFNLNLKEISQKEYLKLQKEY